MRKPSRMMIGRLVWTLGWGVIMDDSDVGLGSGGASSFQQVALTPHAAQPLLPLPPASITEDMEKEIRALHVSLSSQNNAGFALVDKTKTEKLPKLEGAAVVLVEDLVAKVEAELIDSEDKITLLNLAIKFKRISKEGGQCYQLSGVDARCQGHT